VATKSPIVLSSTVLAVFDDFLTKLEAGDEVEKSVAGRLRHTLLEAKDFDAASIRNAVLGEPQS